MLTALTDEGVGILAPGWHFTQPGVINNNNTNEPQVDEYIAGLKVSGTFQPLTVGFDFKLDIPGISDPVDYSDKKNFPDKPLTLFDETIFETSFTFGLFPLPKLEFSLLNFIGSIEVNGKGTLDATVLADKGQKQAQISGQIEAETSGSASFKFDSDVICDIPFVKDLFCQEFTFSLFDDEKQSFDLGTLILNLPVAAPNKIDQKVNATANVFAKSELKIDLEVFLKPKTQSSNQSLNLPLTNSLALPLESSAIFDNPDDIFISTIQGFGNDSRLYYRYVLDEGFEIAGRSSTEGNFSQVLPPNSGTNSN